MDKGRGRRSRTGKKAAGRLDPRLDEVPSDVLIQT